MERQEKIILALRLSVPIVVDFLGLSKGIDFWTHQQTSWKRLCSEVLNLSKGVGRGGERVKF